MQNSEDGLTNFSVQQWQSRRKIPNRTRLLKKADQTSTADNLDFELFSQLIVPLLNSLLSLGGEGNFGRFTPCSDKYVHFIVSRLIDQLNNQCASVLVVPNCNIRRLEDMPALDRINENPRLLTSFVKDNTLEIDYLMDNGLIPQHEDPLELYTSVLDANLFHVPKLNLRVEMDTGFKIVTSLLPPTISIPECLRFNIERPYQVQAEIVRIAYIYHRYAELVNKIKKSRTTKAWPIGEIFNTLDDEIYPKAELVVCWFLSSLPSEDQYRNPYLTEQEREKVTQFISEVDRDRQIIDFINTFE